MLSNLKQLFGLEPKVNFSDLMKEGAQIIDVRSPGEFNSGHIKGSINIPLQNIQNNLSKIKRDKPVITCCASGMRSASAKSILKSNGYKHVHNGGGWSSLRGKL
ncbi:MAG: rhodanese-like domain-containing protein [Flavobacteriia bacterium]|jgi:rhodanese-related sulfurtransferase